MSPEYRRAKIVYKTGKNYPIKNRNKSKRKEIVHVYSSESESDKSKSEDEYINADRMRSKPRAGKKVKPKKFSLEEGEISKPFHYVERVGLNNLDKKLDARESLTMWEYLIAFVKMLYDEDSILEGDIKLYLKHLEEIMSNCKNGVEWKGVRAWSQSIFDMVEEGEVTWEDKSAILSHMISHTHKPKLENDHSNTSSHSKSNYSASSSNRAKEKGGQESKTNIRHVICRDWNRNECQETSTHKNGYIKWLHNCLYCYGEGFYEDHPCMVCPWKTAGWQPPPSRGKKEQRRKGEGDHDHSYLAKN